MGALSKPGYTHPKYYQLVENFCIYLQAKQPLQPQDFHGDIAKICKLFLGGGRYFEHVWIGTPKMVISTCFSACQK